MELPVPDLSQVILSLFGFLGDFGGSVASGDSSLVDILQTAYVNFSIASYFVSLFLMFGIVYSVIRTNQVKASEAEDFYRGLEVKEDAPISGGSVRWERVQNHMASGNHHEWRLAILEADIMLDDLVFDRFGDLGETLGERLKIIDKSDFQTINKAWEAHKARNAIAHEGADIELSEREANRIIRLYEDVLREFEYI